MVDALYPAIDAIIETQGSLKEIMTAAAAAADAGAEQTSTMVARFGRAKIWVSAVSVRKIPVLYP